MGLSGQECWSIRVGDMDYEIFAFRVDGNDHESELSQEIMTCLEYLAPREPQCKHRLMGMFKAAGIGETA